MPLTSSSKSRYDDDEDDEGDEDNNEGRIGEKAEDSVIVEDNTNDDIDGY